MRQEILDGDFRMRQLEYATEQRRAILSHNSRDFYPLARSWTLTEREHYGIVLAPRMPVGSLILRMAKHLDQVAPEVQYNVLLHLG